MIRIALGVALLGLSALPASAWQQPGWIPPCDNIEVIGQIKEKFAYANRKTFHWGVVIDDITHTYETPEVVAYRGLVQRRYCRGTAWMSDGSQSEVIYLIEGQQGFASIRSGVQSCLPEYDPWHVYDAWCRSIEP